jgi:hypothetical protein
MHSSIASAPKLERSQLNLGVSQTQGIAMRTNAILTATLILTGLANGCRFAQRERSPAETPVALAPPPEAPLAQHVASALAAAVDTLIRPWDTLPSGRPELYAEGDTAAWTRDVIARLRVLRPALIVSVVPGESSRGVRRDGIASRGVRVRGYEMIGDTAVVDVWLVECNPMGGRVTHYITRMRWRFQAVSAGTWRLLDQRARDGSDGWCTPRPTLKQAYQRLP